MIQSMTGYGKATAELSDKKINIEIKSLNSKVLEYLHEELDKLDPELVYTTGEIVCHPNVHTVIPDYVDFSLEACKKQTVHHVRHRS